MSITELKSTDIAIVGLAGRFPGAKNVREFWENLCQGIESITFLSDEEMLANGVSAELLANPRYVKADANMDGHDLFDATFFGYSAREATLMDPQQRIFLECCLTALEDAGHDPERSNQLVGVYAGAGDSGYLMHYLYPQRHQIGFIDPFEIGAGNSISSLPTRVSYKLNLKGPSLAVQTACSSSLVAVHLAVQSLLNEECDVALAGGVNLCLPVKSGYFYQIDGLLSPDGRCRPFDANARGTIFGSGVGVVVLKRLQEALEDGDLIRAVIKGSAVNNDGASKAGFTAPNPEAQAEVVAEALSVADVYPDTINYIEAHGTGTSLGDPIEITALTKAFNGSAQTDKFCAIGSVKANIGHLDAAAGVAGLIKTVLALQHRQIPPSLNFQQPNPNINFEKSPFRVNTQLCEWPVKTTPRRAGVSSFGLGGTNCHIVLEESPEPKNYGAVRQWHLLPLSAKTASTLETMQSTLSLYLKQQGEVALEDVAFTFQTGRWQWPYRRYLIASESEDAINSLQIQLDEKQRKDAVQPKQQPIVFLFPSETAQALPLAKSLYREEPLFRKYVTESAKAFAALTNLDIHTYLAEGNSQTAALANGNANAELVSDACLFILEYAVARMLMDWGVTPKAVAGAGIGRYAAACVAGMLKLEDALALLFASANQEAQTAVEFPSLASRLRQTVFSPAKIPYLSDNSQEWLNPQEATQVDLWKKPPCDKQQFESQLQSLIAKGFDLLVTVGPESNFLFPDRQLAENGFESVRLLPALASVWNPQEGNKCLHETIGRLWLEGLPIQWQRYSEGIRHRKTSLPTYPFEGKRFWPDAPTSADTAQSVKATPSQSKAEEPKLNAIAQKISSPAEHLRQLFIELLGIEEVSDSERFTDLGGDSLLATQLASRIRDTFGVTVTLRSILEQPTIAELAAFISAAKKDDDNTQLTPITQADRNLPIPLSYGQQRLWFLDSLEPGNPSSNINSAVRIEGQVETSALDKSINEIIRRHEVLRTAFIQENGQLVQAIRANITQKLAVVDLTEIPADEQNEVLQKLAQQESRKGFDLHKPPLLRVTFFKLSERQAVLLFTIHHIVSDGWSTGVFVREMAKLYEAFLHNENTSAALPELALQYADYAIWQRQKLDSPDIERLLSYWRKRLAGPLPSMALPTDRPRPAIRSAIGRGQAVRIPAEITNNLRLLSNQQGVTLYMTLLAAFAALLKRYSSQNDLLIGTPIANRMDSALETLIGFFVNVLVLRVDTSGNPKFTDLLERVREITLEAYSHQELPFEKLVEDLQPPRDASRTPLFDVMFVLQNTPASTIETAGITLTNCELDAGIAAYDLTLSLEDTPFGLDGWIEYNADIFDADTIARLVSHWQILLQNIASDPERRIEEIAILPAAETRQLLNNWSGAVASAQAFRFVHDLVSARVEEAPDAIAAIFEEQTLTYAELNRRANQLANRLRQLGAGPDVLIGLYIERSIEMVIGWLGVLRAGAAYVPIDPAYPAERVDLMLREAGVSICLTQASLQEKLPSDRISSLCLDSDWHEIAIEPVTDPLIRLSPENLAYVIYTSGSTGTPKAVMVPHRGLYNLTLEQAKTFRVTPQDRHLQFSPLSFDASVHELALALCHGAQLVMAKAMDMLPTAGFVRMLQRSSVTIAGILPSSLALIEDNGLSALHTLIVAGEPCPVNIARRWSNGRRLINEYGTSETTIWSTKVECTDAADVTSIGRPITNAQTFILDDHMKPVPTGVVGELYVGGIGLARGYMRKPEMTAERFLAHPFSSQPGARLYKTGDCAKYLADGRIELLGRVDQQIKLHGIRIELSEIEAVLIEYAAIKAATVCAQGDGPDKALIAYVVCTNQAELTVGDIQRFLQERLPAYMVPSLFVEIEHMPLTPNGKVDRKALPAPVHRRSQPGSSRSVGESKLQREVAAIVEEILRLEDINPDDNLFELGAHSLLMVKLKGKLDAAFNRDFAMIELFKHPSVNALVELIGAASKPDLAAESAATRAKLRQQLRRRRQSV
jgi:amino acid adenylation domain-containing protein